MAILPVSHRALIQRINRKLASMHVKLKTGKGRYRSELGYYLVDTYQNVIRDYQIDLESLAKKLNCLARGEALGYFAANVECP